jgi:M6 family metalloprotease-like protein
MSKVLRWFTATWLLASFPFLVRGQTCSTTGVQNMAVLLVTFSDVPPPSDITLSSMNALFFGATDPSLTRYWSEASYGQTSTSGNVYGWFTVGPQSAYSCSTYDSFVTDALNAAIAGVVNFNNFTRVTIITPGFYSCWAGISDVGCTPHSTSAGTFNISVATINSQALTNTGIGLVAHECGHQLGLLHARRRDFTDSLGNPIMLGPVGLQGTQWEYGDCCSAMAGNPNAHYASGHKVNDLQWLTAPNYVTITTGGTYTIVPYELTTGLRSLKVQRGTGGSTWLWVEYRQATPYDSSLPGSLIHLEDSYTIPQHTDLLEYQQCINVSCPEIPTGQTWTDPYTNVSISVLSADSSGLTVSVNYGAEPCTLANPVVGISPTDPSVSSGSSVNYTVSVTDVDGQGCSSDTFNLSSSQPSGWSTTFSPTTLTLSPGQTGSATMQKTSPPGTAVGTYPVNVTATNAVNGSFATTATANASVTPPALTVSLSASGSVFNRGQTVFFTAKALYGSVAAAGAQVIFTLTKADGSSVSSPAITADATGTATWSYKITKKDPRGVWSEPAQATYNSLTATSNTVTFTVQ